MWEKRLLLCFIINAFNVHNVFPYLHISLKTTNTSESFSMHTLVDFEATRVFINRSFVEKHSLNIYKLSKSISMYNVNSTPNEDG